MSIPGFLVYFSAVFAVTSCFPGQGRDDIVLEPVGNGGAEELANAFPDEEEVNLNTENAEDFFEGDILLTLDQTEQMIKDIEREMEEGRGEEGTPEQQQRSQHVQASAVIRNPTNTWPNAIVPYVLSSGLPSSHVAAIRDAMDVYTRETCVRFVRRTNQRDYVMFYRGDGCYSYVGRTGGRQEISIGNGCQYVGIVIHEIFHALGRWHEQNRPDRDSHVRIQFNNILEGREHNFRKRTRSFASTQGVPYDIQSIMHYEAHEFSSNGQPTIVPVDPSISLNDLGQRQGLADSDIEHVTTLYCGGSSPSGTWSSWGSWSSCSRTCNGGTRSRFRTCVGGTDCQGSNIMTAQCNTASCPGFRSLGCWYLNTRTGRLRTLEGRTADLSDDPTTRTDPVGKCGVAAREGNFNFFGVTLGHCISGSNLLSDYRHRRSGLCRDGRGGYNSNGNSFVMNVYQTAN